MPGEELVGERPEGESNQFKSLFVPMTGQKNQLIGYIEAYDPLDRERPTEEVVRLIEVFASKAASNIELQRAYGEVEQQSRTDGLTGLYNHRFFQERLIAETARAQRFDKPLTLLMIDVDDFKEFDDASVTPRATGCSSRWPISCSPRRAPTSTLWRATVVRSSWCCCPRPVWAPPPPPPSGCRRELRGAACGDGRRRSDPRRDSGADLRYGGRRSTGASRSASESPRSPITPRPATNSWPTPTRRSTWPSAWARTEPASTAARRPGAP